MSSHPLTPASTIQQPSGHAMPILGFGVYQTPAATAEPLVLHALTRAGYRHVDSARAYRNEAPCARAIAASGIPRADVFFTSKIPPKAMGYAAAREAIDATLAEIEPAGGGDGGDGAYVDLYLIHAPYAHGLGPAGRLGAWRALVEAQAAGKIRSIGVSNYGVHHLEELAGWIAAAAAGDVASLPSSSSSSSSSPPSGLSDDPEEARRSNALIGKSKISVNQVELHPWLPRQDIVDWCNNAGVVVQAYSPLVRGARAHEPVLRRIGDKHGGRTWAQVLLRWSLQRGFVPLPKSETPSRIEENARVFDFELDDDDLAALSFPDSYAPVAWDPTVAKLDE